MLACPNCGRENLPDARFCSACGTPLTASAAEARKTVTVMFCDVVGSTALGEQRDPESIRAAMSRYFGTARGAIERHGGTVEKFAGDAVMAVFGIPQVHEDDVLRGLRAAMEIREAVGSLGFAVRVGVNTGEVVAGERETLVTGDAVNVAARLQQAADPGEVLIGLQTERIASDLVRAEALAPLTLKGKSEPVPAFRLLEVMPSIPAFQRPITTPFVGREAQLTQLVEALGRSQSESRCELCTILGPPGIGKSRLARELVHQASNHRVLVGRCLSYGEGITFWPLAEIVRQAPRLESVLAEDEEAALVVNRIRGAIGAGGEGGPAEETSWAFRRLFEALAREQPLLLIVDDIHWAEPTLLDLLEYVASFATEAPILLLCLARPDLLDERPTWVAPRSNATVIQLEGLREEESEDLVDQLAEDLADETRVRVVEAAGGNPLFVEQLLAHQSGLDDGGVQVPSTIQALLAARIDRLSPDERAVIERASVEGRMFHRGAVMELLPEEQRPGAGSQLIALMRKELIRPDAPLFPADDGFRFGHILIRDAAYDSAPKQLRAELHERYADWLEKRAGERVSEYEELLGYHLEQAHDYRAELGTPDPALGRRAAARLSPAGERALGRGDLPAARDLLDRALELGDRDPELLRAAALAHSGVGDLPAAEAMLEEAANAQNETTRWRATVELIRLRLQTDPDSWPTFVARTEEARDALESLGDDAGLAKAYLLLGDVHNMQVEFAAFEEAATRAAEHARRAGASRDEQEALAWLAMTLFYGPRPASDAIERCEELIDHAPGRYSEGGALVALGALRFAVGETALGQELCARAHEVFNDLGMRLWSAGSVNVSAVGAMAGGDLETAERLLRWGIAELEEMGEHAWLPNAYTELGHLLCEQGEYAEAESMWNRVAAYGWEDPWVQVWGHSLLARIRASQDRYEEALGLARGAVESSDRTDMPLFRGDSRWDLAQVARQAGQRDEADAALREAIPIYEQKGMTVAASRARALLAG
jgi:class 3 adenylate cyclase/tetratricopeptide (TPR) repeat protein